MGPATVAVAPLLLAMAVTTPSPAPQPKVQAVPHCFDAERRLFACSDVYEADHCVDARGRRTPCPPRPVGPAPLIAARPQPFIDRASGVTLRLEPDGRHIDAISADGRLLWRRDPFVDARLRGPQGERTVVTLMSAAAGPEATACRVKQWACAAVGFSSGASGTINLRTGQFEVTDRGMHPTAR